MSHSIFGGSYPPGCSGPDGPWELPDTSDLCESVLVLLENAGIPTGINDQIMKLIEQAERLMVDQGRGAEGEGKR